MIDPNAVTWARFDTFGQLRAEVVEGQHVVELRLYPYRQHKGGPVMGYSWSATSSATRPTRHAELYCTTAHTPDTAKAQVCEAAERVIAALRVLAGEGVSRG